MAAQHQRQQASEHCEAFVIRASGKVIAANQGFQNVTLGWSQKRRDVGPAAIVVGETGGSGGGVDYYAVTFTPGPKVEELDAGYSRPDGFSTVRGRPHFSVGFSLDGFEEACGACTPVVEIPVRWQGGHLEADIGALTSQPPVMPEEKLTGLLRCELAAWLSAPASAYPSTSLDGLLALMLSGHAAKAREIVFRAWPRDVGRAYMSPRTFWADLCRAIVTQDFDLWHQFDLRRLLQSGLIEAAAAGQSPSAAAH